jgi:hypothetical protein
MSFLRAVAGHRSGEKGKDKGKGKAVPVLFLTEHYTMMPYRRSGGIAPLIR